MQNYQEFDSAVKELLLFKNKCPYYFGLQSEEFPPPNGIPDFEKLHQALAQLNDWYGLDDKNKKTSLEKFKVKYDFIVGLIASDDFSTKRGNKSLHWPSQRSPYLVTSLINAGAKVNAVDIHGNSPLMFALMAKDQPTDDGVIETVEVFEKSQLPIINALLDAGADITQNTFLKPNQPQVNPILSAIQEKYSKIVQVMLDHPNNKFLTIEPKLGIYAIKNNDSKILRLLINHSKNIAHCPLITADTKLTDTNVCTKSLLLMAALSNHLECVQELLKENIHNNEIKLALKLAIRPRNEQMISSLITAALKPEISGLIETQVNLILSGNKTSMVVKFGIISQNEFNASVATINAIRLLSELGLGTININVNDITFYQVRIETPNTNQTRVYSNDTPNRNPFFNNTSTTPANGESTDNSIDNQNSTTNNSNS
ncbi:MAG: ankyrin repeat domain-containing protein [Legionella sp.]|jgi:ankyrin repeat protein